LLESVLQVGGRLLGPRGDRLSDPASIAAEETPGRADITIDLTGQAENLSAPSMRLVFDVGRTLSDVAASIAAGELPRMRIIDDAGEVVAEALPMIDNRASLVHGIEDVLARAVSLVEAAVDRAETERIRKAQNPVPVPARRSFARAFLGNSLPELAREVLRRQRYRQAHWRVGYRFVDGPGVAETGDLSGPSWSVLPDDGTHFYADPFPFEHEGRQAIFVEDYVHAEGKAVISVSQLYDDGVAGPPRPVIVEDHHLSYPQVFSRDGAVWMLPESSASNNLVLYRCEQFPDHWVRHGVLIEGRALSDATLLEHDGKLWLFATDRDGAGSTSDMLVVYYADRLEGPWQPHPANPVLIDCRRARPGGAFVETDGRLLLPVQDGTQGYGGGLGLSQLRQLTTKVVDLAPPNAIETEGYWPYPMIHTLNRTGRLEVIDGIAEVPING
ncbi:MAG: hypothetical protein KDJ16_17600, partial [Hyphomicrobiales bacterium]|nr:hypothetical protein [Hyphomicrobiales bacterium]